MIEIKDMVSDDFSPKLSLRYYPRSLAVRAKEDFTTPSRMVTDTEYKSKGDFLNQIKLDDHAAVITQYFKNSDLESFINKNGAMKKLSDKIMEFTKVAIDSPISTLSLRPSGKEIWPTLTLEQAQRFVRFLDIAEGRLTTRSLPPISVEGDFEYLVNSFCAKNDEHDSVIWLDLRDSEVSFRKKIDIVLKEVKEKRLQIIGFQMKMFDKFEDYNVNLDYIYSKLHQEEVLLVLEGPNKTFSDKGNVGPSKLHYHPFESFDIISPTRYERGWSDNKKSVADQIGNIKFLKTEEVSVRKYQDLGPNYAKISKYTDANLKRILSRVEDIRINSTTLSREENSTVKKFRSFSQIQQIKEGESELNAMSKRIRHLETYDYLNEKSEFGGIVKTNLRKRFPDLY